MAYEKTNWIDNETKVSAAKMNKIEEKLFSLDANKVDKDGNKVLSTEDYTSTEKAKVANLPDDTNAQLAEKAQNFKIKNEVVNGDFSQGTNGWSGSTIPMSSAENNELIITVNDTFTTGTRLSQLTSMQVEVGDKLYYRFEFKPEYVLNFRLTFDEVNFIVLPPPTVDVYKVYSGEHTLLTSENVRIRFNYHHGSNIGKKYRFKKVSVVNRTKIFGAGNEPTKLEMDELMKVIPNGWWDGELSLTQKQYITWQLNLIRKNTNAIIALGGTII